MERVEWENEGDSTHEKSGAVCMEVCCVGFGEMEISGWCCMGVWMIKSCEWRMKSV